MQLSGSEILIQCLKEQSVDKVFGYPGGAVLYIYDALYRHRDEITHYLTSHEQGAAHMADGYARATGRTGVCIATSGPGATNLVTGIATAYMDSVPMVAITGNVSSIWLGKDSFQEVDTVGITMPITKHGFLVKDARDIAATVRRAFHIAAEGRPGPVVVDITKDATAKACEYEYEPQQRPARLKGNVPAERIEKAADMIRAAQRPVIYAGGGVILSGASEELKEFAELADCPVCLSTMALGGFPASSPRYTGMVGMHGTKASNIAVTECDLLIAIGARFSDRVVSNVKRFAPNAKILHIDIDPSEINKNVVVNLDVVGDVKDVLSILNRALEPASHGAWNARIAEIKEKNPLKYARDGKLRPQYILERIAALTRGKAIYATDVGQHQMWACQYLAPEEPRTFITSGGLGTMGYGLGAAIGAAIGRPDKLVFNITGDGCFRMNNIELATAVEYNAPVIDVIMNNHVLGMVRQWQTFFYDSRFSQTDLSGKRTDFLKIADAYGAAAFNVTEPGQVDEVILKAISLRRPTVINCEICEDEKVFPMVEQNAGIDEQIME